MRDQTKKEPASATWFKEKGASYFSLPWHRTLTHFAASAVIGLVPLVMGMPSVNAHPIPIPQTKQQSSNSIHLGVVRSGDNREQWSAIAHRLEDLDLQYTVIDVESLDSADSLTGITVLFLPNVETLDSAQVITLGNWINQGGRVITSGAVGQDSAYGVQRALRSLLGAYWASDLDQPEPLISSMNTGGELEAIAIQGGVLQASGLSAQPLATWAEHSSADRAAVIATSRTVLLGWEWGTDTASEDIDTFWFKTALQQLGTTPLSSTIDTATVTDAAPPDSPLASLLLPPSERSQPAVIPPLSSPPISVSRSPSPSSPSTDPAEQVAPAGIPVEVSQLPITTLEAIAMREELKNLIGRFESALLAANAATSEISLTPGDREQPEQSNESDPVLVATAEQDIVLSDRTANNSATKAAEQAQTILNNFSDLVKAGEFETARRQWLEARQLLWDNLPTDRSLAQPEVRAIWLDRGTIVEAGSKQRLAEVFDQIAASGMNTVFVETVNAGYPIYPSKVAPQQNPLTRHWDPLAAAVELGHERGLEVHAWVWTFAAGNTRHNELLRQPSSYLGPILEAHPDWAAYDNSGRAIPLGQTKPFLDPANPAVRNYLLRLYDEIVTNYDVDGLQLDYIRYPFQDPGANRTYGYGTAAREQFKRLTGVDPINISPNNPDLWEQWTEFRVEQINSFVANMDALLDRHDPSLVLSTAVFAISEHDRVQKIQQNWEVWAREGDVDIVVTMSYAMDTNRLQKLVTPWVTSKDLGDALIIPSIRLLDLSDAATFDQIQALRDMPSSGYALFATENLRESLQAIFERTQGNETVAIAPIPYRDPFGTAAARYDALLREWSFLLATNDLPMTGQQYEAWKAEAEALSVALHQLADHPSPQHLQHAQQQLDQFQVAFDDWMQLQRWSQEYRFTTWENRLLVLEKLLKYGDRHTLAQR